LERNPLIKFTDYFHIRLDISRGFQRIFITVEGLELPSVTITIFDTEIYAENNENIGQKN